MGAESHSRLLPLFDLKVLVERNNLKLPQEIDYLQQRLSQNFCEIPPVAGGRLEFSNSILLSNLTISLPDFVKDQFALVFGY